MCMRLSASSLCGFAYSTFEMFFVIFALDFLSRLTHIQCHATYPLLYSTHYYKIRYSTLTYTKPHKNEYFDAGR